MSIFKQITSELTRTPNNLKNFLQYPLDTVKKGPKGWVGDRIRGKTEDNQAQVDEAIRRAMNPLSPNLESGGELDPDELSGPNQAWRKKKFGRLAHNLNRRDASILTEG